jgi:hypothetical protein
MFDWWVIIGLRHTSFEKKYIINSSFDMVKGRNVAIFLLIFLIFKVTITLLMLPCHSICWI